MHVRLDRFSMGPLLIGSKSLNPQRCWRNLKDLSESFWFVDALRNNYVKYSPSQCLDWTTWHLFVTSEPRDPTPGEPEAPPEWTIPSWTKTQDPVWAVLLDRRLRNPNLATSESFVGVVFEIQDFVQKSAYRYLKVEDLDPATAEKHRLIIIVIIIVVIIIVLWYNKDIRLPVQAQRGVQWFCCCYGTMKLAGIGCCPKSSVRQPTVSGVCRGGRGLWGVSQIP